MKIGFWVIGAAAGVILLEVIYTLLEVELVPTILFTVQTFRLTQMSIYGKLMIITVGWIPLKVIP